jgi:type IV pilus assembly protein PilA
MYKIYKNRRGFTLVEIVLVIAIIVLLAAVVGLSVSRYLRAARTGSSQIHSKVVEYEANNAQVNASFSNLGY